MKKYITFFVVIVLLPIVYHNFFNKNYDGFQIHEKADRILVFDVKNIRKNITLERLKDFSIFNFSDKKYDFGLEPQDYICVFHLENEDESVYYFISKIQDKKKLEKAFDKFEFTEAENNIFESKERGFSAFLFDNKIILSNKIEGVNLRKIALEIISKNKTFDKFDSIFSKMKDVKFWIKKNSFFKENTNFDIVFNGKYIEIKSNIKTNYSFEESDFSFNENQIINLGVNFNENLDKLIDKDLRKNINKKIGFSIDSLFSKKISKLAFSLDKMVSKIDSAVTYEYDDDFNKVEIVTKNIVDVPIYRLNLKSKKSDNIFHFFKKNKMIDDDNIFVNMPLSVTYASFDKNDFELKTANFNSKINKKIKAIAFFRTDFHKDIFKHYLAKNIDKINLVLKTKTENKPSDDIVFGADVVLKENVFYKKESK